MFPILCKATRRLNNRKKRAWQRYGENVKYIWTYHTHFSLAGAQSGAGNFAVKSSSICHSKHYALTQNSAHIVRLMQTCSLFVVLVSSKQVKQHQVQNCDCNYTRFQYPIQIMDMAVWKDMSSKYFFTNYTRQYSQKPYSKVRMQLAEDIPDPISAQMKGHQIAHIHDTCTL